jgi:hypothetical protein
MAYVRILGRSGTAEAINCCAAERGVKQARTERRQSGDGMRMLKAHALEQPLICTRNQTAADQSRQQNETSC